MHNLNESAGGYAGLATLIWLAPLAFRVRRRSPRVAFLAAMAALGAMGAFRVPPVENLLRACPVLDVTDNRRLTLWLAFALTLLGGIGVDQLGRTYRLGRGWLALWILGAAVLGAAAWEVPRLEPAIRSRAVAHYRGAAERSEADAVDYRVRADRQVRAAIEFLPRYYGLAAAELVVLAALALAARQLRRRAGWISPALLVVTLTELALFGYGLNPANERRDHEREPAAIARLRQGLAPGMRAIGVGEELPPNVLMRFGLADVRNYDSVELEESVAWLDPIFETLTSGRSSRRDVTWASAIRAVDRLRGSCVGAIVGSTPPPAGAFARVERAGRAWIAWLDPAPWAEVGSPAAEVAWCRRPGEARFRVRLPGPDRLLVRETRDPGWTALVDGRPAPLEPGGGPFLKIDIKSGEHDILLTYDPREVRIGLWLSACSLAGWILALTGFRRY